MTGQKLADGLRAFALTSDKHTTADVILVEMGYPEKLANSIIDRLARRGLIEYGVSPRTGWLTKRGRIALMDIEEMEAGIARGEDYRIFEGDDQREIKGY